MPPPKKAVGCSLSNLQVLHYYSNNIGENFTITEPILILTKKIFVNPLDIIGNK